MKFKIAGDTGDSFDGKNSKIYKNVWINIAGDTNDTVDNKH